MIIGPVEGISPGRIGMPEAGAMETPQSGSQFLQMIGSQVHAINDSLNGADAAARALAAGENVPVHDVMIAIENAHLKLQFAVEVRNRIVDAYQNLTNMQL